ncbi:hypothetical protein GA-1p49 [Bacillus phage GA1]|uniref:Uncharacterized protein n=1 Tax=Bacillus phage GA-1 TaxID=2679898 RepID=Q9FZU9_BPGA1|nr:hypothetical protein GA-1p49 [Bacillus phage GA1]CAC21547.1 hypothetical protein [Bacillus phage GA1]
MQTTKLKDIRNTKGFIMKQLALHNITSGVTEDGNLFALVRLEEIVISFIEKKDFVEGKAVIKDIYGDVRANIELNTFEDVLNLIAKLKIMDKRG